MSALFLSMFMLGLVTSIHCISMCGPMVVTYAVKSEEGGPWHRKLVPNVAYQGAKILSYVLVGLALGAIGSAFSLDGVRPYIMLLAGVFMVVMGLGMTGRFPWATKITPRPPRFLIQAIARLRRKANADAEEGTSSMATPITFGLLTGLMPCAPLMAAQLAAAGTGSIRGGGTAMLAFGLGTAPLMLAFGTASSLLPKNFKQRLMSVLAIVVIVFGTVYLNRGLTRLGSPVTFNTVKLALIGGPESTVADAGQLKTGADGVVEVPLTIANVQFVPNTLQVPADKPVRLVVDRQEANACSDQLAIPQLGVQVDLKPNAVTAIDLPPSKAGNLTLTCGMGMMAGQILVGGGSGSPSAPSPLPGAALAFAGAGSTYWFVRRRDEATAAALARRRAAQQRGRRSASSSRSGSSRGRAPSEPPAAAVTPGEMIVGASLLLVAAFLGLIAGGLAAG